MSVNWNEELWGPFPSDETIERLQAVGWKPPVYATTREAAIESLTVELESANRAAAAMRAALVAVETREACDMDHETGSAGAAPSHRCGAEIARVALAAIAGAGEE